MVDLGGARKKSQRKLVPGEKKGQRVQSGASILNMGIVTFSPQKKKEDSPRAVDKGGLKRDPLVLSQRKKQRKHY